MHILYCRWFKTELYLGYSNEIFVSCLLLFIIDRTKNDSSVILSTQDGPSQNIFLAISTNMSLTDSTVTFCTSTTKHGHEIEKRSYTRYNLKLSSFILNNETVVFTLKIGLGYGLESKVS